MSSSMKPLALAELVHSLFCDFDTALGESGLFKIDNMGDAYVCCAWLPETPCAPDSPQLDSMEEGEGKEGTEKGGWDGEEEEAAIVHSTLLVARRILRVVSNVRRERGIDLDVRIGIGTGTCVAGTMGKLQARFHVFGPAMAAAEALERGCPRGHVHINTLVMATLRRQQPQGSQGFKHGGVHGADHASAAPPAFVSGDKGVGSVLYGAGQRAGLWELVSADGEAGLVHSRAMARGAETLGYWDDDGAVQPSLDTASSFVLLPVL